MSFFLFFLLVSAPAPALLMAVNPVKKTTTKKVSAKDSPTKNSSTEEQQTLECCGRTLESNASFCTQCGYPIKWERLPKSWNRQDEPHTVIKTKKNGQSIQIMETEKKDNHPVVGCPKGTKKPGCGLCNFESFEYDDLKKRQGINYCSQCRRAFEWAPCSSPFGKRLFAAIEEGVIIIDESDDDGNDETEVHDGNVTRNIFAGEESLTDEQS